ncbi:MAG TPA: hypothetical protein VNE58_04875 [Casimicrobiaceae bacterium]|nr:hypothetical protein [Casimicrobiaceae bacterium]
MTPRHLVACCLLTVGVTACTGSPSLDPRRWFSRDEVPRAAQREAPGVEARLQRINSAASGIVKVRESGDLLIVSVVLAGVGPGTYRAVLHENGNCTSPNGFSAGAPWSSPGAREPATRMIPEFNVTSDRAGELIARLRGVRMGDLMNRGVLVYEGITPIVPKPDARNNVVACGSFVKSTTLF